ncbi:hypothetical protein PSE_1260 [Pseudovibrio sp. FO-BEG1]|nr:hypothetical protein PSE_1260 [Pseudovibrio sp. FO-BEG1]
MNRRESGLTSNINPIKSHWAPNTSAQEDSVLEFHRICR